MNTEKLENIFVISYAPLLKTDELFAEGEEKIRAVIDQVSSVDSTVKGCIWSVEPDGTACANFVVPRGNEIATHLKEWAEGNPEERFRFAHLEKDGTYVLALMPDVEKSVERVKDNYSKVYGKKIADELKYQILFNPLTFLSQTKTAYDGIREHLKDAVWVSIIEYTDDMPSMPIDKMKEIAVNKRILLGKFGMESLDMSQQFLTQVLGSKK